MALQIHCVAALALVFSPLRATAHPPIDLWHLRSTGGRTKWSEPQRIFDGYCGSLQGVFQLKGGRIIAPFADWLLETTQSENFANLDAWHLFKGIGPAKRFWRDRVQGPQLIPGKNVLQIRNNDGAVWNFPAALRGTLTLRACGSGQISLTDRMFEPCDDTGEKLAAFSLPIISESWQTLRLVWNEKHCTVTPGNKLAIRAPAGDGLSYLHLRSAAGLLVESVNVTVAE